MVIKNLDEIDLDSLIGELKLDQSPFRTSTSTSSPSNLICANQNHLFVYVEQIGAFLTLHLTTSKQSPDAIVDTASVQVRIKAYNNKRNGV